MTSCDGGENTLTLGYDLDMWNGYGAKIPVTVDISLSINSHILLCGMSGSGKSYAENCQMARLALATPNCEMYFADYKGEDAFSHLRGCPRYYAYKDTLKALDAVHDILNARLSGEDTSRNPVTLIWDEYMANILALTNEDKKLATVVMNKVSEILLMGRSMGVRLISSMQRPDALAFPAGSRLNYGIVIILGGFVRSIYEMLMPDHLDIVKNRQFGRGEGAALLQGSELRLIKIPTAQDMERVKRICINALS